MKVRYMIAAMAMVVMSCSGPRVQRTAPACPLPPPPPLCQPAAFSADSVVPWNLTAVAWTIHLVQGADSEVDSEVQEWGLVPHGSHDLLLRGTNAASTTYHAVRRIDATTLEPWTHDSATVMLTYNIDRVAWDEQPTLSPNGRLLLWSSNRSGGMGGTDLVCRVRDGDQWLETAPLAGVINTPCDELSPQFVDDTTVVFSSSGHQTMGGYDLFVATIRMTADGPVSSNVTNLGAWINTEHDEIFPRMIGDTALYFGSNRPRASERTMDVYVALRRRAGSATTTTTIAGTVRNQVTNQPVVRASVTARQAESSTVLAQTVTNEKGAYTVDVPVASTVIVAAEAPGLFFDEITVTTSSSADSVVQIQPLALPVVYTLRINFPSAVFDQPYEFTLDSTGAETRRRWVDDLDRLAANLRATSSQLHRVVLVGHTDDVDTDESNFALGEQRVRFVIEQLVERGVDRALLEARSAGERQMPTRAAGESIERWRKRARRVELQKVELH